MPLARPEQVTIHVHSSEEDEELEGFLFPNRHQQQSPIDFQPGSEDLPLSPISNPDFQRIRAASAQLANTYAHGQMRRRAYKTGGLLGTGTEGTVKVATVIATGERVAIKIVRKPVARSSEASLDLALEQTSKELRRKFEVLAGLRHPNLLTVIEQFETEDKIYLVTELCQGDLKALLEQNGGALGEKHGRVVVEKVLRGISFLHANGIAHRDLKPQNILVRNFQDLSTVCIADFEGAHIPKIPLALPGGNMKTVIGTPYYIAPCVIHGRGYGPKIDCWSVGVIAYELVYGRTPFATASTFIELYQKIIQADWRFPEGSKLGSDKFRDLVSKLLVVDPVERLSADDALPHPWFASHWAQERLSMLFADL